MDDPLAPSVRAITSLAPAIIGLEAAADDLAAAARASERGHFRPDEEDRFRSWFARYLTARLGLLQTIDDLAPRALPRGRAADAAAGPAADPGVAPDDATLRAFAVAYTAAAVVVRSARFLIDRVATDRVVQRKLNEAAPHHRIPRKQYTAIYRGLTHPRNAWRLRQATQFADRHRDALGRLGDDALLAPVLAHLAACEPSLRAGVRTYLRARLRYRWHAWRRRRASAAQRAMFGVFEGVGRVVADVRMPRRGTRLDARSLDAVAGLLRPGDVLVTRHDRVLSNLLLPGYWPHAALYVGPAATRAVMAIAIDDDRAARWVDPLCVLEARKDGVLLRALDDTLAVDACAVLRPRLDDGALAVALANALTHEGKLYNFDFDFFTDERLVCTEVVYRAYEGVGGITFPLARRSGRPTLSAEDILDLAVDRRGFDVVAVFGTPGAGRSVVTGAAATEALIASYRAPDGRPGP